MLPNERSGHSEVYYYQRREADGITYLMPLSVKATMACSEFGQFYLEYRNHYQRRDGDAAFRPVRAASP